MPTIEETLKKGALDFKDISIYPFNKGVIGTLYTKKKTSPVKGIVLIHGMWCTREDLDLLSKRLADQGYGVYSINLPAHGEDLNEFNIALASEYVSTAVRNLRLLGMKRVGVIGYSAGAVASVFASCGYNRRVERDIYVLFERCVNVMNKMANLEKKYKMSGLYNHIKKFIKERSLKIKSELMEYIKGETNEFEHYKKEFDENFREIKKIILEALKQQRFSNQRIDSLVLIGLPLNFQDALPLPSFLIKKITRETLQRILDIPNRSIQRFMEKENLKYRYSEHNLKLLYTDFLNDQYIKSSFLKIGDLNKFVDYMDEVKNPRDYLNLISFFSERELEKYEKKEKALLEKEIAHLEERKKEFGQLYGNKGVKEIEIAIKELEESPPILSFIRRYKRDIIDNIPKLFIQGRWDQFSRPFIPGNKKKIKNFYGSLGNIAIVYYKKMMHGYDKQGIRVAIKHLLSYPKMMIDITNFLNQTL